MIVSREVAVWCGSTPAVETGQGELWALLKLCDQVVAAFELESVLAVDSVVLEDWLGDPRGEVRLGRPANATIEATWRNYFREQGIGPNVSAALVTLEGTTTIREPDGADSTAPVPSRSKACSPVPTRSGSARGAMLGWRAVWSAIHNHSATH